MIVLDTNVLSAVMAEVPVVDVQDWMNAYPLELLFITSITVLEVRNGLGRMPQGRRRAFLERRFQEIRGKLGGGHVLSFDELAAEEAGRLAAARSHKGVAVGLHDTQIAGICLARGMALATRNTKDFSDAGIPLFNPWAP